MSAAPAPKRAAREVQAPHAGAREHEHEAAGSGDEGGETAPARRLASEEDRRPRHQCGIAVEDQREHRGVHAREREEVQAGLGRVADRAQRERPEHRAAVARERAADQHRRPQHRRGDEEAHAQQRRDPDARVEGQLAEDRHHAEGARRRRGRGGFRCAACRDAHNQPRSSASTGSSERISCNSSSRCSISSRLRLLRELDGRGTIGAVADALSYSPSAVSQQLALLEREAGVPLLERAGRNVRLTAAAQRLVLHTDALMARMEEAEADLEATAEQITGTVRVAAIQSAGLYLLAPTLRRLAEQHPALRVEVTDAEPEASMPGLALGTLDLVLADEYPFLPRPPRPAPGRGAAARGALPHPAARRPSARRGRRTGRARRPARRAVGGRQGRQPLRRADDPRLPGARRLRARRAPPLQRPFDAARARRLTARP